MTESTQPKCEACGLQSTGTYQRVHTTNGGLLLCVQCLGDINRKNPELLALREKLARLEQDYLTRADECCARDTAIPRAYYTQFADALKALNSEV